MTDKLPPVSRIAAACSLSPIRRRAIAESFFGRHPGTDRGALGCGRAVAEFLDWEIASGRVRQIRGSRWWQVVNGLMMLDLRDAEAYQPLADPTGSHPGDSVAGAWAAYVASGPEDAQAAFWRAHELSLQAAARAAIPLLADESEPERRFTKVVLDVSAQAAAFGVRTDTGLLGMTAWEMYPHHHPITDTEIDLLTTALEERGVLVPGLPASTLT